MSEPVDPAIKPESETAPSSIKGATMDVKVYAPFHVYFEGEALSVSAVNDVGPFDILPKHRNFICMLVPCELVIKVTGGEVKNIRINRALMHVRSDRVVVFVDV